MKYCKLISEEDDKLYALLKIILFDFCFFVITIISQSTESSHGLMVLITV